MLNHLLVFALANLLSGVAAFGSMPTSTCPAAVIELKYLEGCATLQNKARVAYDANGFAGLNTSVSESWVLGDNGKPVDDLGYMFVSEHNLVNDTEPIVVVHPFLPVGYALPYNDEEVRNSQRVWTLHPLVAP